MLLVYLLHIVFSGSLLPYKKNRCNFLFFSVHFNFSLSFLFILFSFCFCLYFCRCVLCILSHFIQYRHEINSINLVNAAVASQQHSNQIFTTTAAGTAFTTNFLFRLPFISSSPSSSHNDTWNHLSNQFSLTHAVHTSSSATPTPSANNTFNQLLNNKNNQKYANHNDMSEWSAGTKINRRRGIYSKSFHSFQLIGQYIERYQFVSYTVTGFAFYAILIFLFFYWPRTQSYVQAAQANYDDYETGKKK